MNKNEERYQQARPRVRCLRVPLASHRTGVLNQTGTGKLLADQIAAFAAHRFRDMNGCFSPSTSRSVKVTKQLPKSELIKEILADSWVITSNPLFTSRRFVHAFEQLMLIKHDWTKIFYVCIRSEEP